MTDHFDDDAANPQLMQTAIHKASKPQSVLFADVAGSTRMYVTLGDAVALKVMSATLQTLETVVNQQGGRVVKTIGDEVMAVFPSATAAALAASSMMRETQKGVPGVDAAVQLRIGFHFGPVLEIDDDIFGDTVNTSARLVKLAKPGQIMTSSAAAATLTPFLKESVRSLANFSLKGKDEAFSVYELIWHEPENSTVLLDNQADVRRMPGGVQLMVRHQDQTMTLNSQTPSLNIGRSGDNQVIVDDPRASRQHAHIELRRDKFVLIDESSNGTYVRIEGQDELFLRREEVVLQGRGEIGIGNSCIVCQPAALLQFQLG